MRILSNVTFLFVSLSYTAESAIVTAFITFIPKFIESQFGIPASSASIYTGELKLLHQFIPFPNTPVRETNVHLSLPVKA